MRVLLADDHELARFALGEVLKRIEPSVVIVECDNLDDASRLTSTEAEFDLMVVDLVMPGLTKVADLELLRRQWPNTPIAMVSGQFSRADVVQAFRCGVSGFVSKSLGLTGLENAFRLILSGEKYVPSEILSSTGRLGSSRADELNEEPILGLTSRQQQVLGELVNGRSNRAIASTLDITEATVKLHVGGVLRNLGAKNRTEAATMAIERGWKQRLSA